MRWIGCLLLLCVISYADHKYFVSGGPLFLYPHQSGLDFATTSSSPVTIRNGSVKDIDFDWGVGGRLEAGIALRRIDFSLFGRWTHFRGCGDGTANAPTGGAVFPIWCLCSNNLTGATKSVADWDLALDSIDVGLYGQFHPTLWIDVQPNIGLKTSFVDQDMRIRTTGPTIDPDRITLDTDMWGIGPRFGVDSRWKFAPYIGLNANAAMALLWSSFDTTPKETQGGATLLNIKSDDRTLRAVLEFNLGPYGQIDFDSWIMRLALLYDLQVYFSQNAFRRVSTSSGRDDGNLSLQGLYLKITLLR